MTVKEQVVNLITAAALMPGSPRMNTINYNEEAHHG
jgi:hypothetical protein